MTPKEFQEKIQQDAFLEYEEVYQGLYYGTLLSELNRLWNQEKHILFDIDVIGGLNIKKKYPNNTLAIFVQPPSIKILEERLKKRATDSEETIQKRIQKAQMEIEYAPKFDTVLINKDLKTAKKEVVQVVRNFIES
jgi:guanylate kinase